MFFVISKLDETKLARMDFLVNFGVSLETIHEFADLLEYGDDFTHAKDTFDHTDFTKLLKVYKYFSWADKKLHSVFYIENKDDISEDLLSDFKDPDNEKKFLRPQVLHKAASHKEEQADNVIVKKESLVSEYDYLFGKKGDDNKIIDVKSKEDFPTLDIVIGGNGK